MKNPYLNINRIEFSVTLLCSGKCKHCSVYPSRNKTEYRFVDPVKASEAVKTLAGIFDVESLMTFGGEPLLYPDVTCRIHETAASCAIPSRQVITNGYFSKNPDLIDRAASLICSCGINDILISVDAFHQETIPLKYVRMFAEALLRHEAGCVRFQPAWVICSSNQNEYNKKTLEILDSLSDLKIQVSGGDDIFPEGRAAKYLKKYYKKPEKLNLDFECGDAPYTDRLDDVRTLSIGPNGDVSVCAFTIGNIYKDDMRSIVERYDPYKNEMMKVLIEGGVKGLWEYAQSRGITADTSGCYTMCSVCRQIVAAVSAEC